MPINYNTACCLQRVSQRQGRGVDEFCLDDLFDSFQHWYFYILCLQGLFFLFWLAQRLLILKIAVGG